MEHGNYFYPSSLYSSSSHSSNPCSDELLSSLSLGDDIYSWNSDASSYSPSLASSSLSLGSSGSSKLYDPLEVILHRFPQQNPKTRKKLDAIRQLARYRIENIPHNTATKEYNRQLETDKSRFRRAYETILEDERREERMKEQRRQILRKLEKQRIEREKKTERIRLNRLAEELEREAESRRQNRKEKEDRLVKTMFDEAFRNEKERVLKSTALAAEAKANEDLKALQKFEATKKLYQDQKDILNERLLEEEKVYEVQKRNRDEYLRKLSLEMKKDFEEKLRIARITLDAQEERILQINTKVIESAFNLLNDTRANYYQLLSSSG